MSDSTNHVNLATSVLPSRVGDKIRPSEHDFVHLSNACLAEGEKKFVRVRIVPLKASSRRSPHRSHPPSAPNRRYT
jgi:hypothetical protein